MAPRPPPRSATVNYCDLNEEDEMNYLKSCLGNKLYPNIRVFPKL